MRSRRSRMAALALAGLLALTAACGDDDDDDAGDDTGQDDGGDGDEGGGAGENTGTVNLMSAGEPEEVEAYQDDLRRAHQRRDRLRGRDRVGRRLRGAVPDPGRGRHPRRRRRAPARRHPGARRGRAASSRSRTWASTSRSSTPRSASRSWPSASTRASTTASRRTSTSRAWSGTRRTTSTPPATRCPTTFDELIALSDQIVADGSTPWCVGFESEGATGWPATDWMEDIMLRTAGPEVYDQWVAHEIPFNDPAVVNAGEVFGQVMFTEGYVLGGAENTPAIAFGDAPLPMFDDPPGLLAAPPGELHQRQLPRGRGRRRRTTTGSRSRPSTRRAPCSPASSPSSAQRQPARGRRLPRAVHRPGRAVRHGWRAGVVADLAQRRGRARLLRQRHPRRRLGDPDRSASRTAPGGSTPPT